MQRVPMSVLGIPLPFGFLATSAVWSGETHDRHTAAALVAGMAVLAIARVWTSSTVSDEALCIIACAPNQTMKMGNDPMADRFCGSLRLVSGLDDSTTGAFLTDADPAFCD
jgi:hypothetical protein